MIKSMTNTEFEKKIQDLIENIKKQTVLFTDDTPELQRKRVEKSEKDLFFFAKTYFPHYIRSEFGKPHRTMHKETEIKGQITGIAGFRGLGKTTFLAIIKPVWLALFGRIFFNVKVAKNKDLAKERTIAIRCEFLFNKRLINDFGAQLPLSSGEEHDFIIKEGTRFLAIGYKEGIRGKIHNSRRPDYIDIDDLEDHNSFNIKIAQDKLQFVTEEAYGAFDKGNGILVWLGNRTHQNSALNLFYKSCTEGEQTNNMRKFLLIPADDGSFNPTWKEHYSKEDLLNIYQAMGKFGYERHMRMNPVVEGLKFKEEWFKYYDLQELFNLKKEHPVHIVSYCDPSLGEKTTSDYKAIMTVAYCNKKYYLLDVYLRKASIIEMLRYMYWLHEEFNCILYMESNFWQKVIWDYIPQLANEYRYLLPVNGIENTEKKELRIERIQPVFEWGWLLFPNKKSEDLSLLIDQLLGFPAYPHDDGPDALAGAISCMKHHTEPNVYKSLKKTTANQFSNLW
ncbi:MAG TPA: phage terminase large subunit [Candidatus Cloacimonadota bacterium]|nr:phage terminase large subunit [Candidatus Cloacimonadota bacterium]